MPWKIKKKGGKWCVVKADTGETVPGGCHDKAVDAHKHLYAIEKNAHG
jgi:hypothetical protein